MYSCVQLYHWGNVAACAEAFKYMVSDVISCQRTARKFKALTTAQARIFFSLPIGMKIIIANQVKRDFTAHTTWPTWNSCKAHNLRPSSISKWYFCCRNPRRTPCWRESVAFVMASANGSIYWSIGVKMLRLDEKWEPFINAVKPENTERTHCELLA